MKLGERAKGAVSILAHPNRVDVGTLCRPLELFHCNLGKPRSSFTLLCAQWHCHVFGLGLLVRMNRTYNASVYEDIKTSYTGLEALL